MREMPASRNANYRKLPIFTEFIDFLVQPSTYNRQSYRAAVIFLRPRQMGLGLGMGSVRPGQVSLSIFAAASARRWGDGSSDLVRWYRRMPVGCMMTTQDSFFYILVIFLPSVQLSEPGRRSITSARWSVFYLKILEVSFFFVIPYMISARRSFISGRVK